MNQPLERPNSHSNSVTLVMASRRTDEHAQFVRERFIETVAQVDQGSGVLIDRTPDGVEWCTPARETIQSLGGRLRVVRQSHAASISDAWLELSRLNDQWIVQFHDDDNWRGVPTIPESPDPSVTLYAPNVLVSDGIKEWNAHEWTTQHALFGAIRGDVFRMIAKYLAAAPNPWGGEDLMMLSFAGSLGRIERQHGYSYIWHRHNWTSETSELSTQRYLGDQGWEGLASLSTYLLLQSLDRLAVFAYADSVDDAQWKVGVDEVLDTFWPVIDRRGHELLRRLPRRLRGALISTRGEGTGPRRIISLVKRVPSSLSAVSLEHSFEAFQSGQILVSTPGDVANSLLPALVRVAPTKVQAQLGYWAECIGRVTHRYSLLN